MRGRCAILQRILATRPTRQRNISSPVDSNKYSARHCSPSFKIASKQTTWLWIPRDSTEILAATITNIIQPLTMWTIWTIHLSLNSQHLTSHYEQRFHAHIIQMINLFRYQSIPPRSRIVQTLRFDEDPSTFLNVQLLIHTFTSPVRIQISISRQKTAW